MKNKFGIKVMPREVILDTEGRAIEQTLRLNKTPVAACRVGKFIELEIEGGDDEAFARATEIAKSMLHNPLIETFEVKKI